MHPEQRGLGGYSWIAPLRTPLRAGLCHSRVSAFRITRAYSRMRRMHAEQRGLGGYSAPLRTPIRADPRHSRVSAFRIFADRLSYEPGMRSPVSPVRQPSAFRIIMTGISCGSKYTKE